MLVVDENFWMKQNWRIKKIYIRKLQNNLKFSKMSKSIMIKANLNCNLRFKNLYNYYQINSNQRIAIAHFILGPYKTSQWLDYKILNNQKSKQPRLRVEQQLLYWYKENAYKTNTVVKCLTRKP